MPIGFGLFYQNMQLHVYIFLLLQNIIVITSFLYTKIFIFYYNYLNDL